MKTISITLYNFKELSPEAQKKALNGLAYTNVEYCNWWESTYYDAENIGLTINGFDIDRRSNLKAEFIDGAYNTANKIVKEHGEICETYKLSKEFIANFDKLNLSYSIDIKKPEFSEENQNEFDSKADELETDYLNSLCYEYLKLLRNEYEYLTSEKCIIENIEANEYYFTIDGKQYKKL